MIELDVTGVHFKLDDKIKKYVARKIGKLDRYVPRDMRQPISGHVILTENESNPKQRFSCEVKLVLPHGQVVAKEGTINMYAAVDITEAKIKTQLLKYKTRSADVRQKVRHFIRRLRRLRSRS